DARAALGERALRLVGEALVQQRRHREAEHRVAEELETLVVRNAAVLVGPRPMRERQIEKLRVDVDAELLNQGGATLDLRHGTGIRRRRPCGPCTRGTARCPASRSRPWPGADGCRRPCRSRWS